MTIHQHKLVLARPSNSEGLVTYSTCHVVTIAAF